MADLTTPIDIQQIQGTADKKKVKITRLMMDSIVKLLAFFSIERGIQHTRDLLTFEEGSIMQPYDPTLATAKDLGVIDKRIITVKVGMLFIQDEIERYRETYLAALSEYNLGQAQLPFAQWYLETIALVGMQDVYLLPWQGVEAGGANTKDIADGFLKIISDEITATNISTAKGNLYTLSGGATDYTSANIGDELIGQFKLLPANTQESGIVIHIPWRYKQIYKEWFKSEYQNITDGDVPTEFLDGTDKKAKFNWTTSMGTTKRVVFATKSTLVVGLDSDNKEFGKIEVFRPQNNPFLIAAVNKVVIGFQIRTLNKREFNCNNLA